MNDDREQRSIVDGAMEGGLTAVGLVVLVLVVILTAPPIFWLASWWWSVWQ